MSDAVARVYAAALFEAADEAGEVERVRAETAEFAAALQRSPQLPGALLVAAIPVSLPVTFTLALTLRPRLELESAAAFAAAAPHAMDLPSSEWA